jgi:uncharacterized protein YbjQ (UPF0145 family)
MRFSAMTICRTLAAICATTVSLSAFARNTEHVLPVDDVLLRKGPAREVVGTDLFLHFGLPLPEKDWQISGDVQAHADVRTRKQVGGRTVPLTDEEACREAFREALVELSRQARVRGATGLVGIVSHYNRVEKSYPASYECHAGYTRAVVDLKARTAVRRTASAPVVAVAAPALPFARIEDVQAVPLLDDRGRDAYRDFLTRRNPRAFAIAPSGAFNGTWTNRPRDASLPADPAERALVLCNQRQQGECKLYAVDDAVVWNGDKAR